MFSSFISNFALWILSTGARKGTNIFNSLANLRKFYRRRHNKSCLKDPYFLCRKKSFVSEENFAKILLAIFPTVFLVHLFSRRRRLMNITGTVAENPWFHYIKTVFGLTVFNWAFQITIVRSCWATMFVLHVDTFKAHATCAPRSHAVKKPYKASFNVWCKNVSDVAQAAQAPAVRWSSCEERVMAKL